MEKNEIPNYYAIIPANVRYDSDLTANAKLLYGEITALCNEKGYCYAGNAYFTKLYGTSKFTVSRWISSLIKKKYIRSVIIYAEDGKTIEERRIYLDVASITYSQNSQDPIDKNIKTLSSENATPSCEKSQYPLDENSKENNTLNNTYNNTINNIMCKFEELWKIYPKKRGKTNAFKAYEKAIKSGVKHEDIERGIKAYIQHIQVTNTDPMYIKHGSTYFKQECWNDEYGGENGTSAKYTAKANGVDTF